MSLNTIQSRARSKMNGLRAGALFMSMGTGKTKVALEIASDRQRDFDACVWIAPASLIRSASYRHEIERWSSALSKPIIYFTVESVSQSDSTYLRLRKLAEGQTTFCIVDESITIKNAESMRTKRLMGMWSLFTFRLILNGTPLSKNLADLYPQMRFLHPKILDMDERAFAERFLIFKDDGRRPWQRWSKPSNEEALVEIIRPYIFDAKLDIPATIETISKRFELSLTEHEEYQDIKDKFLEAGKVEFLPLVQKLQAFYSSCQSKLARMVELTAGDEQFIIYVKFLREIDALREVLPEFIEYSGRHKDDLSRFISGSVRLLVMTYGTGSMGLNLQNCRNVVFFTQTFDQKDKTQALHRVYRTGQLQDVRRYELWVETGLEKIIEKSLDKKQSTMRNVEKFIQANGVQAL